MYVIRFTPHPLRSWPRTVALPVPVAVSTGFSFYANKNLTTGEGNDTLVGSTSDNILDGGPGNDTYFFGAGFGADSVLDASGDDTLDLEAFPGTVDLSTGMTLSAWVYPTQISSKWASILQKETDAYFLHASSRNAISRRRARRS